MSKIFATQKKTEAFLFAFQTAHLFLRTTLFLRPSVVYKYFSI